MTIILSSDEYHDQYVFEWLQKNKIDFEKHGSLLTKQIEPWTTILKNAAKIVSINKTEGIFFCWSGTGASIVANKVNVIRAALCFDSETAKLARIWNKANILVIPNRLLEPVLLDKILSSWFMTHELLISDNELKNIE